MNSVASLPPARADAVVDGQTLTVRIGGEWQMTARHPDWSAVVRRVKVNRVVLDGSGVTGWDSSLALYVREASVWSAAQGATLVLEGLPSGVEKLVSVLADKPATTVKPECAPEFVTAVGLATFKLWQETKDLSAIVGECAFSLSRMIRGQAQFRWRDCLREMQLCGAMALPIVGLISFLVGVTLAYTGSIVVRQYGGDIWIADMVGLAVTREMGAMMAAIVLAGRTGAAYAATLGNMKANEEIDALATLGVSPVDFLVMPRIVALFLMMPFLTLYSDLMGIVGGMAIAALPPLNIPPNLYFAEMQTIVDLSDINTGVLKGAIFGLLVGVAGCWRGMQAERSAAGVGAAATRAVVTAILLIIVCDAICAVFFDIVGW